MIAHKYPGILLELSSAEVIWLHYTKFFMELEGEFDSCMHVYKEPTGVYYKLTGNFSPNILEEAKQKTLTQVNKNKIEMLKSDIDAKHYSDICIELRLRFPRVYIQLLPYNVFDQLSRRLHDKFGYKQALEDFAEITKKKKKFCFLVCDKVHFNSVKEAYYQIIEPLENAAKAVLIAQQQLQQALLQQQQQKSQQIQQNKTWMNSNDNCQINSDASSNSSSLAMQSSQLSAQGNNNNNSSQSKRKKKNIKAKLAQAMRINIHNLDKSQEQDISGEMLEGVDVQKEEFPCLLEMQNPSNMVTSSSSSVSSAATGGQGLTKKDSMKRRANRRLKKKMQAELVKAAIAAAAAQQQQQSGITAGMTAEQSKESQHNYVQNQGGYSALYQAHYLRKQGQSQSSSDRSSSSPRSESPILPQQYLAAAFQHQQQLPIQLEGIDEWELEFLATPSKQNESATQITSPKIQEASLVSSIQYFQDQQLQGQQSPFSQAQKPQQQLSVSQQSPPLLDALSYSSSSAGDTTAVLSTSILPKPNSSACNIVSDKTLKMMSKIAKSEPFHPDKQEIKPLMQNYLLEEQFCLKECIQQQNIFTNSSSDIFKVSYKDNIYCMKVFKNLSAHSLRLINTYSENLKKLAAPRIIRLFGKTVTKLSGKSTSNIKNTHKSSIETTITPKLSDSSVACRKNNNGCFEVALLLEYKDKNLQQAIETGNISSLDEKIYVFWQIAVGLQQLHSNGMAHGNLKPSNILLSNKGRVQLCDFFVMKGATNDFLLSEERNVYEAWYSHSKENYSPLMNSSQQPHRSRASADIWCLGLLGYYIFTHHYANAETAVKLIKQSAFINTLSTPKNPSVAMIYKLILQMTDLVAERRPQIEQVLNSLIVVLAEKFQETTTLTTAATIPHSLSSFHAHITTAAYPQQ